MSYHWFRKPIGAFFTPLLLAVLFAVACGTAATATPRPAAAPSGDTSTPAATSVPAAQPEPTAAPPQASTGRPKVNRLIVTGTVPAFETTDPFAMTPSSLPPVHPMYENLLQFYRSK